MTAPEATGLPYIEDGNIKKIDTQKGTSESLEKSSTQIKSKAEEAKKLIESGALAERIKSLPEDQQKKIQEAVARIGSVGTEASLWKKDNYEDEAVFDQRIVEKAMEYGRNNPSNNENNYFDALGNKYDQAVGASEFFDEFATKAGEIKEISEEDKRVAAYHLWEKITKYSEDLKTEAGRIKLLEDKSSGITQEEVDAILSAGLLADAKELKVRVLHEPSRFLNPDGSVNQEKWNQAVFETASEMLEKQMLKKIQDLGEVDTGRGIYEKAMDVYQRRTGKKEATPDSDWKGITTSGNPPISPENEPIDSLDADALQNADVEPGVEQSNNSPNETAETDAVKAAREAEETKARKEREEADLAEYKEVNEKVLKLAEELDNARSEFIKASRNASSFWRKIVGNIKSRLPGKDKAKTPNEIVDEAGFKYEQLKRNFLGQAAEASVEKISEEKKNKLAYDLAERIRSNGKEGKLVDKNSRKDLVDQGVFTEQEMRDIEISNLLIAKDIEAEYNKTDFNIEEEWNQGVFKVASGLLEREWHDNFEAQFLDLYLDEDRRFREEEFNYSKQNEFRRIMNTIYKNPAARAAISTGLALGTVAALASGNLPIAGALIAGRTAFIASGVEGGIHAVGDLYQSKRGDRKDLSKMTDEELSGLSTEEKQRRISSFAVENRLKGKRMQQGDTEDRLNMLYGIEAAAALRKLMEGKGVTGSEEEKTADILEDLLTMDQESFNKTLVAAKIREIKSAEGHKESRWGGAIGIALATVAVPGLLEMLPKSPVEIPTPSQGPFGGHEVTLDNGIPQTPPAPETATAGIPEPANIGVPPGAEAVPNPLANIPTMEIDYSNAENIEGLNGLFDNQLARLVEGREITNPGDERALRTLEQVKSAFPNQYAQMLQEFRDTTLKLNPGQNFIPSNPNVPLAEIGTPIDKFKIPTLSYLASKYIPALS